MPIPPRIIREPPNNTVVIGGASVAKAAVPIKAPILLPVPRSAPDTAIPPLIAYPPTMAEALVTKIAVDFTKLVYPLKNSDAASLALSFPKGFPIIIVAWLK